MLHLDESLDNRAPENSFHRDPILLHQEHENNIQYNIENYNNFIPDTYILANERDIDALSFDDESSTGLSEGEESESDESVDIEQDILEDDWNFLEDLDMDDDTNPQV